MITTGKQEIVLPVNIASEVEDLGMTQGQVGYVIALAKSGMPIEELFLERHPEFESLAERIWNYVNEVQPRLLENLPIPHEVEFRWFAAQQRHATV